MQNNYSLDAYRRLIEISSSINVYERTEKNKFFAAEIWECNPCKTEDFPLWHTNTSSLNEKKYNIFNLGKSSQYSSYMIYNGSLILSLSFPIYSYKIHSNTVSQQKKYTLKFYKKTLDFGFIKNDSTFFNAFFNINLYIYLILLILLPLPIYMFKKRVERNTARDIDSKTLENVKNMIEHELINQENILKYPSDFETTIQAVLHHNKVAQITLRSVLIENINPLEVLQEVWSSIGKKDIEFKCTISIQNKVKFDKSTLYLAFNTILKNATHESLSTKHICIEIKQKNSFRSKKRIRFKISNDGLKMNKDEKEKIFKGFSSKKSGHGIGLKNLKEILKKSGCDLILAEEEETCFVFEINASEEKMLISESILIPCIVNQTTRTINESPNELLPWVVIIEDNEMIWNGWKTRMKDAKIFFFRTPDDFFYFIDEEKMNDKLFLSKIEAIICDFDFGNGINFINSNLIGGIEREEELFYGKFILCTGFNEKIQEKIPQFMREKIDLFFQKKHISFQELKEILLL